MATGTLALLILIGLGTAAVVWGVSMYNGLVKKQNIVEDAWSGIEVQLKKRHNLIPNLVTTIKGYAKHEKTLLESIVNLRKPGGGSVAETGEAEQALTQSLQGVMVQVEEYPDLKADGNFKNLQDQLSEVENDIQSARRYYNGAVRDYNTVIQSFPSNMIANHYSFREAEFFELDIEAARQTPEVDFG